MANTNGNGNGNGHKVRALAERAANNAIATMAFRGVVGLLVLIGVAISGWALLELIAQGRAQTKINAAITALADDGADREIRLRDVERRLYGVEGWIANRVGVAE